MSRVQLALAVDDLERSVAFYSALLGAEPAKRRPGYANFAVADPPLKLVLLEKPGQGGRLDHLGVEVGSSGQVHAEIARLGAEGLHTDEELGGTCCYATQDKSKDPAAPHRSQARGGPLRQGRHERAAAAPASCCTDSATTPEGCCA